MKDYPAIIVAEGLTKVYAMGKFQVEALKDVTLSIPRGAFLGITGPSGSGKSTLLNLIGGLDTPTAGTIQVRGQILSRMSNEELAQYRRADVGMIFQAFNLISTLTAEENVALPSCLPVSRKRKGNKGPGRFCLESAWVPERAIALWNYPVASSSGWPSPAL